MKLKISLSILLGIIISLIYAQENNNSFASNNASVNATLSDSAKVYITFMVDRKGKMSDVKVDKVINNTCDPQKVKQVADELVEKFKSMHKWKLNDRRKAKSKTKVEIPVVFECE